MGGQRAVVRADRVLEEVARASKPLSLSEIARSMGAPVSSTSDLLDDLVSCGYLVRSDRIPSGSAPDDVAAGGSSAPHWRQATRSF
ncbi:helix-turn-helix domain-containing protein [Gordonia sputi]